MEERIAKILLKNILDKIEFISEIEEDPKDRVNILYNIDKEINNMLKDIFKKNKIDIDDVTSTPTIQPK